MTDSRETSDQAPFRVLVVDDNQDAANTLSRLLKLWGFEVEVAYDGAEALATAQSFKPDCVITDIGLPKLDGYSLAERIRQTESLRKTTLIAVTAYSDAGRAKTAGFDHHLVKPADPLVLEKIIKELLAMGKRLERTQELIEKQGEVVMQARDLMKDVKGRIEGISENMQEIKQEIREVKEDVKEVKEELRQVKEEQKGG